MRLLVEANLSPVVAQRLTAVGFDASHVIDHGLGSAPDEEIVYFAATSDSAVISADTDFATILALGRGSAPPSVLFRSADALTPEEQAVLLIANLPTVEAELAAGAVVSISPRHLRVRRLPLRRTSGLKGTRRAALEQRVRLAPSRPTLPTRVCPPTVGVLTGPGCAMPPGLQSG